MLTVVLGAPGSGKTTVARRLRSSLSGRVVVVDWDDFMPAVEMLIGRGVRTSPELWNPYRHLVRSVVEVCAPVPVVVLGVCTPEELADWPEARWVVLDCDDDERRRRLTGKPSAEIESAVADGRAYRGLGLPIIDSSGRTASEVVADLVRVLTS